MERLSLPASMQQELAARALRACMAAEAALASLRAECKPLQASSRLEVTLKNNMGNAHRSLRLQIEACESFSLSATAAFKQLCDVFFLANAAGVKVEAQTCVPSSSYAAMTLEGQGEARVKDTAVWRPDLDVVYERPTSPTPQVADENGNTPEKGSDGRDAAVWRPELDVVYARPTSPESGIDPVKRNDSTTEDREMDERPAALQTNQEEIKLKNKQEDGDRSENDELVRQEPFSVKKYLSKPLGSFLGSYDPSIRHPTSRHNMNRSAGHFSGASSPFQRNYTATMAPESSMVKTRDFLKRAGPQQPLLASQISACDFELRLSLESEDGSISHQNTGWSDQQPHSPHEHSSASPCIPSNPHMKCFSISHDAPAMPQESTICQEKSPPISEQQPLVVPSMSIPLNKQLPLDSLPPESPPSQIDPSSFSEETCSMSNLPPEDTRSSFMSDQSQDNPLCEPTHPESAVTPRQVSLSSHFSPLSNISWSSTNHANEQSSSLVTSSPQNLRSSYSERSPQSHPISPPLSPQSSPTHQQVSVLPHCLLSTDPRLYSSHHRATHSPQISYPELSSSFTCLQAPFSVPSNLQLSLNSQQALVSGQIVQSSNSHQLTRPMQYLHHHPSSPQHSDPHLFSSEDLVPQTPSTFTLQSKSIFGHSSTLSNKMTGLSATPFIQAKTPVAPSLFAMATSLSVSPDYHCPSMVPGRPSAPARLPGLFSNGLSMVDRQAHGFADRAHPPFNYSSLSSTISSSSSGENTTSSDNIVEDNRSRETESLEFYKKEFDSLQEGILSSYASLQGEHKSTHTSASPIAAILQNSHPSTLPTARFGSPMPIFPYDLPVPPTSTSLQNAHGSLRPPTPQRPHNFDALTLEAEVEHLEGRSYAPYFRGGSVLSTTSTMSEPKRIGTPYFQKQTLVQSRAVGNGFFPGNPEDQKGYGSKPTLGPVFAEDSASMSATKISSITSENQLQANPRHPIKEIRDIVGRDLSKLDFAKELTNWCSRTSLNWEGVGDTSDDEDEDTSIKTPGRGVDNCDSAGELGLDASESEDHDDSISTEREWQNLLNNLNKGSREKVEGSVEKRKDDDDGERATQEDRKRAWNGKSSFQFLESGVVS